TDCTDNCRICAKPNDPVDAKYWENVELVTVETQPSVSFEAFEEAFALTDEKTFKWATRRDHEHAERIH
ncbi:unnamed protein product, partial [Oikopleura dioica]